MTKILLTGATGFVGRNVLPTLKQNKGYEIYTPTRSELNLKDEQAVLEYLKQHKFDIVLHLASPTPAKNPSDSMDTMLEDSIRIFLNFFNHRDLFGKMIYTGSGAEFDKTMDMNLVAEEDCYRSVPKDQYGVAKMLMNRLAETSDNVYNFRLFGCYGPGDHESKFITHCIRSIMLGKEITIRKDCKFDYIHVYDVAQYFCWGIDNELKSHSYNVSSGIPVLLSDIAKNVISQMGADTDKRLLSVERNRNYTASNTRIVTESGITPAIPLSKGIEMQIKWEKDNWSEDTRFDGE